MKWIKSYEQIITETKLEGKLDTQVQKFCLNQITESKFIEYLESELTTEGLSEILKSFKEKVIDILWTFLKKASEIGFVIFEKVSTFITWLLSKIRDWREKNPSKWRVAVIVVVVLILLIVSASTAKAATTGQPVPIEKINMAIGWLDSLKGGGEDPMILQKAIAHLVDLKDGHCQLQNLGKESINMVDAALKTVEKMIADSKDQDPGFYKYCMSLMDKGKEYVDAIYTQSGGLEGVKLVVK